MASAPGVTLEFQRVSKSYPDSGTRFLLTIDDLRIPAGAVVGLLGPSGSGKSTFLNLAAGIDRPTSGRVLADQTDLAALRETDRARWRAANAGFIFQGHLLPMGVPLREAVAMPLLWARNALPRDARHKADALLERVGLAESASQPAETLSGGQRQRAAVARALIAEPRLLIADEPTGQLDAENARAIVDLVASWAREHGATLIVVSHDEKSAPWPCTERFELRDGKLAG